MVRGLLSTLFATAAGATVSQKVELSDGMCFVEEKRSMSMWPTWTLHISVITDLSSNSKITSDVSKASDRYFLFFFFFVPFMLLPLFYIIDRRQEPAPSMNGTES